MNYREALAWLYATQRFGIKLGLENIERLIAVLTRRGGLSPSPRLYRAGSQTAVSPIGGAAAASLWGGNVIHVAGTNGKGSVCAFVGAIARVAGYRTGLFTSPHLVSFRERIRVSGEIISKSGVAKGLTEIRSLISNWDPHPTFFEITTALALQHFQETRCEILILETGMGGRLDATNAIQSNVSVITSIDFDHEKWLGYSIAEIASEKAGIIKTRVPVISAPQREEAKTIIEQRALECDAPLHFISEPWTKTKVSLRGEHQKLNAAIAIAAVRAATIPISDDAVTRGLESVEWPARFQIWDEWIVIDGAHNPAGAKILAQTWREEFGDDRATILLAILREKNAVAIVNALKPIANRFLLPQIRSERAESPDMLASTISSITPSLPHSMFRSSTQAISAARKANERVLITGSLHFAGEALAILRGEPEALEECAQ